MTYLISQMVFYLIIAGAFGFILGWFVKAVIKKRELSNLERIYKINLASQEQELEELRRVINEKK